jgi:hypothetical protein
MIKERRKKERKKERKEGRKVGTDPHGDVCPWTFMIISCYQDLGLSSISHNYHHHKGHIVGRNLVCGRPECFLWPCCCNKHVVLKSPYRRGLGAGRIPSVKSSMLKARQDVSQKHCHKSEQPFLH